MDHRIIKLYDEYTHKPLTRDEFIKRLVTITGSFAAAMNVLPLIEVNQSHAAVTPADDLFTERISYKAGTKEMKAYVARPLKTARYDTVIVIHENRGLNAHIEDVARRLAQAGYLAIAPDALSVVGGTPENADAARELFSKLDPKETIFTFISGFENAAKRTDSTGSFGCVGFCWGGALANQLAVHYPDLKAAVSFYGRQPEINDVPKIRSAVQLHYGALDERINAGIPAYEEALRKNNIPYELYVYDNAHHAFHNDTAPTRYNEAAAKLAWQRTLAFFEKYL